MDRGQAAMSREVGRLMQAFARAARARQIYNTNNAVLEKMLSDLTRGFQDLLAKSPDISIKVRAEALLHEDEPILEEPNPDDSIPFTFYRDGIRRIDFSRGLPPRELEILISATARGFAYSGVGDDVVSFLWAHDLEHIHYLVVDTTIVDAAQVPAGSAAGDPGPIDVDAQIAGLLHQIYGPTSDDVGPRSLHIDGSELAAKKVADALDHVDEMAPGFHPPRTLLQAPVYVGRLKSELPAESDQRIAARAVRVALNALAAGAGGTEGALLLEALLRMFDAAVMEGDIPLATRIVAGVRQHTRGGRKTEEWMEQAVSEARLRQVAASVTGSGVGDPGAVLVPFFRACGARAVTTILHLLPTVPEPNLRRALSVLALELGITDLEPIRELLTNEQGFVAQEALFLLNRVDHPHARALMREAEVHPRPQVRIALLDSLSDLPKEQAQEVACRLLSDPDGRVQIAAAKALAPMRTRTAALAIEGFVEAPGFEALHADVRREMLKTYAQLSQMRAMAMLSVQIKRGEGLLAKREAEDNAAIAIEAIALIRTPRTVEVLKKACGARSKKVREGARAALLAMKERA